MPGKELCEMCTLSRAATVLQADEGQADEGRYLAGADIDEESGGKGIQHHLCPGVDVRKGGANAHADWRGGREGEQEQPCLPAPPMNMRPCLLANSAETLTAQAAQRSKAWH